MTPYRQPIRPGESGTDVVAVKRALKKAGFGRGLILSRQAGPQFVQDLKRWQTSHGIPSDGVYGPGSHAKLAPLFDAWGVALYRRAPLRTPPRPTTARGWAQLLLTYEAKGLYHADNPGDLRDVKDTAAGQPVVNQAGQKVWIDARVFECLCNLIEAGHRIGTYAICSDHSMDSGHGHSEGFAVDISTIDGVAVSADTAQCRSNVVMVDLLVRKPGNVRQLITGGYGNHRDTGISSLSVPAADSYYTSAVMAQHCNHIHVGY